MIRFSDMFEARALAPLLSFDDVKPARDQLQENAFWWPSPRHDWFVEVDKKPARAMYRYDPPKVEVSRCQFRNELLILLESGYLVIVQEDESFEVGRFN